MVQEGPKSLKSLEQPKKTGTNNLVFLNYIIQVVTQKYNSVSELRPEISL